MEPEEIKETARKEKDRDIKPIANDFYDQAGECIRAIEDEMMAVRPRSLEFKMLDDQLLSAVSDVETVFMRRIGKVVDRATSSAFSTSGAILLKKDFDKLLPAERELFETVFQAIMKARKTQIASIVDSDPYDTSSKPASGKKSSAKKAVPEKHESIGDALLKHEKDETANAGADKTDAGKTDAGKEEESDVQAGPVNSNGDTSKTDKTPENEKDSEVGNPKIENNPENGNDPETDTDPNLAGQEEYDEYDESALEQEFYANSGKGSEDPMKMGIASLNSLPKKQKKPEIGTGKFPTKSGAGTVSKNTDDASEKSTEE